MILVGVDYVQKNTVEKALEWCNRKLKYDFESQQLSILCEIGGTKERMSFGLAVNHGHRS